MGEYTIDDLVAEGQSAAGASSGGSDGSGAADLIAELDDRGVLDRFMQLAEHQMTGGQQQQNGQASVVEHNTRPGPGADAAPEPAGDGGDAGAGDAGGANIDPSELDADQISNVLKKVYDSTGMAPGLSDDPTLSELIKWVENHPQLVNQAVKRAL